MSTLSQCAIAFVLTLIGVRAVLPILRKRDDAGDAPGTNGSQALHGGGFGVLLGILLSASALTLLGVNPGRGMHLEASALFGSTLFVALTATLDDLRPLARWQRFALQTFAVALLAAAYPSGLRLLSAAWPMWAERTVLAAGLLLVMQLYRAADTADGVCALQTVSIATGTALVLALASETVPPLSMILVGSGLAFMAFNWPPARVLLSETGSLPLGLLTGTLLAALALTGAFVSALILAAYLAVDGAAAAGITLRAWPHRSPGTAAPSTSVSCAVSRGLPAEPVVLMLAMLNIALALLASAALKYPATALIVAYAAALSLVLALRSGTLDGLLRKLA